MTIKMVRLDGQIDPSERTFAFFDDETGNFCAVDVGEDLPVETWQNVHELEIDCERWRIASYRRRRSFTERHNSAGVRSALTDALACSSWRAPT